MPFIPAPNCARVELIFQYGSERCENVYHVRDSSTPYTVASLNAIASVFKGWWSGGLQADAPTTLSLIQVDATALDTPSSPGISYVTGLPLAGARVAPQLPNNVTVAVKWLTALRGRSFRGRTYHMGLFEAAVTENTLNADAVAGLTTLYNNLIPLVNTGSTSLVVMSYFSEGTPRAQGTATPILSATIDPTIDSQRRRLPGRGE